MEGGEDEENPDFLERLRGGDPGAWDQLLRRLYPRLRAWGTRRVGPENVDDIVNEAMLCAARDVGRFRGAATEFDGWVFGIARNVVADHHRRSRRWGRRDRHYFGVAPPPPDEGLLLDADHESVRAAFEKLTPREREVLELRVIAGLSADQAGTALGKRPGTVRVAQSRALAHLRLLLDGFDE